MEAAACYVAECRDPSRDAKIALTAEGLYGLFIYAATAIVFVAVLGASLKSSDPLTEYTSFADHIFGSGGWVKYLIGIPLIGALLLSVLNAIMGVGRSLFQASEDRLIPKFFAHKNKHHAPDHAMFFNLVCAMVVALFGSPVRIYIFSNVGYLIAIVAALVGYFVVRQFRPGPGQPVPPARLLPVDRPGHGGLPHLRLLRGRVGIAGHRGRPRSGSYPLPSRLRRRGRLRTAPPLAPDDRQA